MGVALCGVLMFFMALVSAYIVRKGFSIADWQSLEIPRVLWLSTLNLHRQQLHDRSRAQPHSRG